MEELQVIETTSGRQFKPWVTNDDLQAAVQDPASITAITSEIASGKQAIAAAINAKGGEASATESFAELAEAVEEIPNYSDMVKLAGIIAGGNYNKNALQGLNENVKYGKTEIIDNVGAFETINVPYCFQYWDLLEKVTLPSLTTISGGNAFHSCSALKEVNMPNLNTISGGSVFSDCLSLQRIEFPNLQTWTGASQCFVRCSSLEEFIAPILSYYSQAYYSPFFSSYNLKNIVVGTLTNQCFTFAESNQANLRNITIGQDTNINLIFPYWTATNVIAEGQSGIDELNSNLYNNLLTKLYDHSNDGQTRTLRIGWLSRVSAENIAYANAKGWTLTT